MSYAVTITTDPEELLDMILEQPNDFDLVITDMTKTKMTSLVLAEKIINSIPYLPVIIATGHGEAVHSGVYQINQNG